MGPYPVDSRSHDICWRIFVEGYLLILTLDTSSCPCLISENSILNSWVTSSSDVTMAVVKRQWGEEGYFYWWRKGLLLLDVMFVVKKTTKRVAMKPVEYILSVIKWAWCLFTRLELLEAEDSSSFILRWRCTV